MNKIKFLPILFLMYSCAASNVTLQPAAATSSWRNQGNRLLSISHRQLKPAKNNGNTARYFISAKRKKRYQKINKLGGKVDFYKKACLRKRKDKKQLWRKKAIQVPTKRSAHYKAGKMKCYKDMSRKELDYLYRLSNVKHKTTVPVKDMIASIVEKWILDLINNCNDSQKKHPLLH